MTKLPPPCARCGDSYGYVATGRTYAPFCGKACMDKGWGRDLTGSNGNTTIIDHGATVKNAQRRAELNSPRGFCETCGGCTRGNDGCMPDCELCDCKQPEVLHTPNRTACYTNNDVCVNPEHHVEVMHAPNRAACYTNNDVVPEKPTLAGIKSDLDDAMAELIDLGHEIECEEEAVKYAQTAMAKAHTRRKELLIKASNLTAELQATLYAEERK